MVVLGAGMVGSAMAIDLSSAFAVTSVDFSEEALARLRARKPEITTVQADLKIKEKVREAVQLGDWVVSAVPGFMGFEVLKCIIEEGKNVVDISFFPEDSLELDALAQSKGVTAVVDCGVAPGMPNYCMGYWAARMAVTSCRYMVGGLPTIRHKPFEYKAPFSPVDVIEEYVRPARLKRNGVVVTLPALSDPELIDFPSLGTLEAFNTDGLRSILKTLPDIPNIGEKTLRYPGHAALIGAFKSLGFFDKAPITVKGVEVSPLDVTSKILFKNWKLGEEEEEFTVMRIEVEGKLDGVDTRVQYDVLDRYDPVTKTSSMARTTGYTATATMNALVEGLIPGKGVFPPEVLGRDERLFNYVLAYLRQRGVIYTFSSHPL